MIRTFQFRLLPSRAQHRALEAILESQRELYNAALEERIGAYRRGVVRNYVDQSRALTELRQSDAEFWAIPANIQRGTLRRLDHAYKGFFRRVKEKATKPGFPRFRSKGHWKSFAFWEFVGIQFDGTRLRFKGMPGALRVHLHRSMPDARIRSCTFRRDAYGWKIGFVLRLPPSEARKGNRAVGVDLGISKFAVLSDGGFVPTLKAARRADRRLRLAQRALARKSSASRQREKARALVARCCADIVRTRVEHLHQASARLVRDYDVIAVEALDVSGLGRGWLARDVLDVAWARFLSMLRYKAEGAGVRLIEVNARNTSQDCSSCGARVSKDLDERWHQCPCCKLSIDRDLNAARNILARAGVGPGLPNVAEVGMRAGGNLDLFVNLRNGDYRANRATTLIHGCRYGTAIPNLASSLVVS